MNYEQSSEILKKIDKAKNILVNLHRSPDLDSFASAISIYYFLKSLDKNVNVVVVSTSELPKELLSKKESKLINLVDYSNFDFSKYDLFISPDSASWQQIVDDPTVKIPKIDIVVIDHHPTNDRFGKINLIEENAASCSEIVYKLFEDWRFSIDKNIAEILLAGIIADTGGFAFSDNSQTLRIAAELMDKGANKTVIIDRLFRTKRFEILKYWGEYLSRMEIDRKHNFIWTALPYSVENKYKISTSDFATVFASSVEETNFGIVMSEDVRNALKISFRSRNNTDVSKLAQLLGGGGHKAAAGAKIEGLPFDKAVETVLDIARKYAKKAS